MTPLLVVANRQTSGRGANWWWSPFGALTFSLVTRPADLGLSEAIWPRASLTCGLVVCFTLERLLPKDDISLKWPNDILLQHRKVGGVLLEIGSRPSPTLVIDIGVNVNNSLRTAPNELRLIATSMIDALGQPLEMTGVLVQVLCQLEVQLNRLANNDPNLPAAWRRRCALRGHSVEVNTGTRSRTGVCQGIDEEGELVVIAEKGTARLFGGVVTQVR